MVTGNITPMPHIPINIESGCSLKWHTSAWVWPKRKEKSMLLRETKMLPVEQQECHLNWDYWTKNCASGHLSVPSNAQCREDCGVFYFFVILPRAQSTRGCKNVQLIYQQSIKTIGHDIHHNTYVCRTTAMVDPIICIRKLLLISWAFVL